MLASKTLKDPVKSRVGRPLQPAELFPLETFPEKYLESINAITVAAQRGDPPPERSRVAALNLYLIGGNIGAEKIAFLEDYYSNRRWEEPPNDKGWLERYLEG